MKANVGSADRIFRMVLGAAIIVAGFVFQTWWGAIGVVLLLTGIVKFCPLYMPFGITTCKTDSAKQ